MVDETLSDFKLKGVEQSSARQELVDEILRVETAHRRSEEALKKENEGLQDQLQEALAKLSISLQGEKINSTEFKANINDLVKEN